MISFDDINFQHETSDGGKKRLIIFIDNADDMNDVQKHETIKFLENIINEQ